MGLIATTAAGFWLPRGASTVADGVDWNWNLVLAVSVVFFVLVTTIAALFVARYRARPGHGAQWSPSHNTSLEIAWTVIPTFIVGYLFWSGYTTYMDMSLAPQGAYEVQVAAQKWNWMFTYPNGYVDGELHVPVRTPVRLVMSSQDVIHSFYVPEFRVKRDVIPGRYDHVWFEAKETGEFVIFCAEYCGTSHSRMLSKVQVHERGDFDAWLEKASDFLTRMPPEDAGQLLYQQRGCKQCHSVDGTAGTGPTFKGLYGTMEVLRDGASVLVDENYVRESVLDPLAKVTAGYEPVMPTYKGRLKDEEIGAVIAYLKTLAE